MKKSALKLAAIFTITAAMGLGLSGCLTANDVLFGSNATTSMHKAPTNGDSAAHTLKPAR